MAKQFTVTDFFKRFSDDDLCLDHLMSVRYGFELDCPKCEKRGKFSHQEGKGLSVRMVRSSHPPNGWHTV